MTTIQFDGINIHLLDCVLEITGKFRQLEKGSHESGGILLGQVTSGNVYLMKASAPNQFDRSSRTTFDRDKHIAQIIIEYEFLNSGNKTIYLGEWHTHPEAIPSPSTVDVSMIKDQFKKNKLNEPFLILLIQGQSGIYVGKFDGSKLVGNSIKL